MNNLSIEELEKLREAYYGMQYEKIVAVLDELITLRKLKGDQVPVAYLYSASFERGGVEGQLTDAPGCDMPVYDRPQKPVVLSFDAWCESKGDKPIGWVREAMKEAYDAAIEAAGSVVKDGE